ncbi:MAG: type II secretion system protein [Thermoanaerobaculia bacterium]|nr:type II secretion system protein [Thermoanaerobaculia bacterium]
MRLGLTGGRQAGFSLAELVIVCALLLILAGVAVPTARFTYTRSKEIELRTHLRTMRNAIDEYKRYSDAGLLEVDVGSDGYPESLELLVGGVEVVGQVDRTVRFLRRIPVDPFTGEAVWGLRSYQDDPRDEAWGGENVFDVYSLSEKKGLDGTAYAEW